jgi:flagellum-specific ATP synthase
MPLGETYGIKFGDKVTLLKNLETVPVSNSLLGRVIDVRGKPVDDKEPIFSTVRYPIYSVSPKPLERIRINEPISTGIKVIDGLMTLGKGQRVGLFSGSGVGKSLLLGMIAKFTEAPVVVVVLVGERGREVRDFLERDLGKEGLKKSVVVVSTSDTPAPLRVKAPFVGTAIAEYFRDQGKDVLLLMDSITRQATAQREIGLSRGEPPATKGFPPSTFAIIPRLMERAGRTQKGSITGIYTVLVEADDITEPISDHARSILDGHIWLSRELASRGHYPAIDPLGSISRIMIDIVTNEHLAAANKMRAIMATYKAFEDLISIGAYAHGSNLEVDNCLKMLPTIKAFSQQQLDQGFSLQNTVSELLNIFKSK